MDTRKRQTLQTLATLVGILGTLVSILGSLVGIMSAVLKGGPVMTTIILAVILLAYVVYLQLTTPRSQIALGALLGLVLGAIGIMLLLA
jgi:hypothetical protein